MTKLEQKTILEASLQLLMIRCLIDDGYHNKEIFGLIRIGNTLFEELSDENKIKFRTWID